MARENATIMAVICLLIGVKLIGDAISGLSSLTGRGPGGSEPRGGAGPGGERDGGRGPHPLRSWAVATIHRGATVALSRGPSGASRGAPAAAGQGPAAVGFVVFVYLLLKLVPGLEQAWKT